MQDKAFAEWLVGSMRTRGVSVQCLADELNVSLATVYRWRTGSRVPIPDSCVQLARFFDIPSDRLLRLTGWEK